MTCETCALSYLSEPDKNFNVFYRCKRHDLGMKNNTTIGTIQNVEKKEVITGFTDEGIRMLICNKWIDEQEVAILKKGW